MEQYECIPEGKGWIVVNLKTSKPAEVDGVPLVGLSFDGADEIARMLNAVGRVLASAEAREDSPPG